MSEFMKASPVSRVRRLAIREVKGLATPAEIMELRRPENLVLWYQSLTFLRRGVNAQLSRAALLRQENPLRPAPGAGSSSEWIAEKARLTNLVLRRHSFMQHVEDKRREVTALLGHQGITTATVGALLVRLEEVLDHLAGDEVGLAEERVRALAGWLRKEQRNAAARGDAIRGDADAAAEVLGRVGA